MENKGMVAIAFLLLMAPILEWMRLPPCFAQESPALPEPLIGLSAEQHIMSIDWLGRVNRSSAKIIKAGSLVRYQQLGLDASEFSIFDYERRKEYRIYDQDHIFFEVDLTDRAYFKAQREGLIPPVEDPRIEAMRLALGTVMVEGHPAEIILQVRRPKGERGSRAEYTLLWEALDLDRLPLRIAYHQTVQTLVVVEYRNLIRGPVDPTLLRVPEGYLNFSPY